MSTLDDTSAPGAGLAATGLERRGLRLGDTLFRGVALAASAGSAFLLGWIAFKVLDLAWPSIQHFGLSFVWTEAWDPVTEQFGALTFIYGTVLTSLIALVIAVPVSIGIALFLTEIAPRRLAAPIATLVELLAAIPSVVLGLWGILVFGPWVAQHLEPFLQDHFGFLPIFSGSPSQAGILPAALVLTIMIVPITSAICRELFLRVPRDLTDGALALGSTRWESIRGVTLAYAAPGIAAAVLLGLGRAFGEAIAVTQVIGGGNSIEVSWFATGDTLASRIASQYQGATSQLQAGSILYLAAILMAISLATNVAAQLIVRRFEKARRAA
jgi:phosphate transport system permease protein